MLDQNINHEHPRFRFSGHETFACRYAWLPKAYRAIEADSGIFFNEDAAMVELGIGKNMVRSLRFWVDAMGVARPTSDRTHEITELGHTIFGQKGADPFLEESKTLWLLHWALSSAAAPALFAWNYLLGSWPYPEFSRSEALSGFLRQSQRLGYSHSNVTLSQHLDVFLHTYVSARSGRVGVEDSLDGPLVELRLLQQTGERRSDTGRWEPVYGFRREPKSEISNELFGYSLLDYWDRVAPAEKTMLVRTIVSAPGGPGQVFKLPEEDVRSRLEALVRDGRFGLSYRPSAIQGLLMRETIVRADALIIYQNEAIPHG